MDASEPEAEYSFFAPTELEAGVYANYFQPWHSLHEFTLDFCVSLPIEEDEAGQTVIPYRVVSRVKVPVTLVFDVLRRLSHAMSEYEEEHGEIHGPGER